jgi:hypothetical protein
MSKSKKRKAPQNKRKTSGHENLKLGAKFRWQPGQSGNPGGRPAFKELNRACREILSSPMPGFPKRTYAEGIAERLATAALSGNVSAAQELADRAEGRPRQAVEFNERDPLLELIAEMKKESARIGPPEGALPKLEEVEKPN